MKEFSLIHILIRVGIPVARCDVIKTKLGNVTKLILKCDVIYLAEDIGQYSEQYLDMFKTQAMDKFLSA